MMSLSEGLGGVDGGGKFGKAGYMARAFAMEFLAVVRFGGAQIPPPLAGAQDFYFVGLALVRILRLCLTPGVKFGICHVQHLGCLFFER